MKGSTSLARGEELVEERRRRWPLPFLSAFHSLLGDLLSPTMTSYGFFVGPLWRVRPRIGKVVVVVLGTVRSESEYCPLIQF